MLAFHPFRSKKPVGVIQEFYGLLLAHYAIRKVMWDAATQAQVDPDCLSFSHALAVVTEAVAEFQLTDPLDHPRLYQRLLCEVARVRLPPRKLRSNPRADDCLARPFVRRPCMQSRRQPRGRAK